MVDSTSSDKSLRKCAGYLVARTFFALCVEHSPVYPRLFVSLLPRFSRVVVKLGAEKYPELYLIFGVPDYKIR